MPDISAAIVLACERDGVHQQTIGDPTARVLWPEELHRRAHNLPARVQARGGGGQGCEQPRASSLGCR